MVTPGANSPVPFAAEEKHLGRQEGSQKVPDPGHSQRRGDDLHGLCQCVRHPEDSLAERNASRASSFWPRVAGR